MGARTRQKDPVSFRYELFRKQAGSYVSYYKSVDKTVYCDLLSDNTKRPCNLSRIKYQPVSHIQLTKDLIHLATYENVTGTALDPMSTWSWVSPYLNRLKPSKLPTSNEADLLTNLAEFDDTLAMLGKSVVTKPSYGGVKWGWMPLVSDILAVNDAANAVKNSVLNDNGTRTAKYVTKDKFSVKTPLISSAFGKVSHTWDVEVKYSGQITYENNILAFYDYMGFHPSPKLLWDLVPLSFAVDYILPIGDTLKAMTPSKGWVKSANFTGWRTVKAKCKETLVEIRPDYAILSPLGEVEYVYRSQLNGVALHEKRISKTIEALKTPTWEQAFDLAYLSEAFYNRGKKIFSPHTYKKKMR